MGNERGFTIIEVLAAAMILVIGLLGALAMIDGANRATTATKAREGGNNLQREVVESARSIPYEDLLPNRVVGEIRESALQDSTLGGDGWTVVRRGVRYTISVGVCSVDDPNDQSGVRVAGRFCSTGGGQTTAQQCAAILGPSGSGGSNPDCGTDNNRDGEVDGLVSATQQCPPVGCTSSSRDLNADDYKRIIVLVRWDRGEGSRFSIQTSTVPNPGFAAGPRVTSLGPQDQVVDSGNSLTFGVETSRPPQSVQLLVDGAVQPGGCNGSPLVSIAWNCQWILADPTRTPDGTYVITAKALDEYGVSGQSLSTTVRLNRRLPPAVEGVVAGENTLHNVTEITWRASRDGDVEQYTVERPLGTPVCTKKSSQTDCVLQGMLNSATTFFVRAWDTDSSGLRQSNLVGQFTAANVNTPPEAVSNLVATSANGTTILSWTAPNQNGGRPDVDFYRIYRRAAGAASAQPVPDIGWRHDTTGSGTETTWVDTDTDGQQWTYWVTAVGLELAESINPPRVTR
jgi:prepilin-type N-terminal cleavage/methylation domain-containing protein